MDGCIKRFCSLELNRVKKIKVLVWFLVPLLLLPQLDGKLLGDHICQTKITVPQEVLQWELKNRTTRTYKWCMSVPPRCSVYATSLVNETKIAVVDVTKSVEACCEGFKEQNNLCVSQCQKCLNGLCLNGFCVCQIGWNGSQCDTPTASSTPDISSTSIGTISTLSSSTLLTTSATTKNVEPVPKRNKAQTIPATEPANTKRPITKPEELTTPSTQNPYVTLIPITTIKQPSDDGKFTPLSTTSKIINFLENNSARPAIRHPILDDVLNIYKAFMSTTTEDPVLSEDHEGSGARSKSRIEEYDATNTPYFDIKSDVFSTTEYDIFDSKEANRDLSSNIDTQESDLDYRELDLAGAGNISLKNNEENTIDQLDSQLSTTKKSLKVSPSVDDHPIFKENFLENIDDFVGERYEKRSSMENLSDTKLTITEPASKHLIYSICAASLTTFLILVIVVTLYAVRNSKKKVENNKVKKDMATVAVFTTSIFHSPLPDPPAPTFDNPTYLATSDNGNNCILEKNDSIEIQEFSVVFQKPVKPPRLDKQYLYDHPPSTGSYRASSEVDTLSQYNSSQKFAAILEPLYDEIPSKGPNNRIGMDSNSNGDSLYMNTCGRTEF
ncbi:unnamed protein product [Ceutorhynchus assimilis]|uniref:EMI domain-containing protein n=1 Tax=Ceutorhynchus assimilis TaxID=467358 RepID=A0A9N9QQE9_9CUCU|nr:unnamed protein product [Ceutorhynchus assimilis]